MKRKIFNSINTNDKIDQLKRVIKYKLNYLLDDKTINDIIDAIDINKQYKIVTCTSFEKFYKYSYNITDTERTRKVISLYDDFIPGKKINGEIIDQYKYNNDNNITILLINDINKNIENNYIIIYINNVFEANINGVIIDNSSIKIIEYNKIYKFKINNIIYDYLYIRDRNIILSLVNINDKCYIKFDNETDNIIKDISNTIYVINHL